MQTNNSSPSCDNPHLGLHERPPYKTSRLHLQERNAVRASGLRDVTRLQRTATMEHQIALPMRSKKLDEQDGICNGQGHAVARAIYGAARQTPSRGYSSSQQALRVGAM